MYLISAAAVTLIVYFLIFRKNFFSRRGIPYIRPFPLLGNMWKLMFRRGSGVEIINEIYNCNKEAKYVGIFEFRTPVLMLRDLELIKVVTMKHFDHFIDHRAFMDPEGEPLMGNNLFSLRGEQWRKIRALLSPAFTSSKMKGMFKLMSECAKNFTESLMKQSLETKEFNSKDIFTKFTNDVIATCAFGVSVDSMANPENDFYIFGKKGTTFDGLKALKFFVSRSFPGIARLFGMKVIEREVEAFFYELVRETIATRDKEGISRPDMIQLMMETRGNDPGSKNPELDIESMTSQAFIFFFGGFETTSSLMCFAAHEVALNPEVQERLQEEIDQVLETSDGDPNYKAINEMQYLDAFISESLRKYPIQVAVDRVCTKSFELPPALPGLKPLVMKPGENLWIPTWAIHRDDQHFPDPDKFDPNRFLGGKEDLNYSAYMPFGVGPRMCIGNRFALLELKVMFFHILAKCDIKISDKMIMPMRFSKSSLTLTAEGGFWLEINPRNLSSSQLSN